LRRNKCAPLFSFPHRDSGEGGPRAARWEGRADESKDTCRISPAPPPPPFGRSPSPASGGEKKSVLAVHFFAPELCQPPRQSTKRLFSTRFRQKKGSGAPRGALSNQCPRQARLRASLMFPLAPCGRGWRGRARARPSRVRGARRLSALTLAALATGSTRWLSSRTGFPAALADRCFACFAKKLAAVKHAPCGPVLVPVDRGPEAARVRIGNSARGHRASLSLLRHAVRNGARH
jgi:hypothetical protein